jgi:hypothetical protein
VVRAPAQTFPHQKLQCVRLLQVRKTDAGRSPTSDCRAKLMLFEPTMAGLAAARSKAVS